MQWSLIQTAAYGTNESDFFIKNTVNASLGPDTPTTFDPGAYTQTDTNLNADFSKGFDIGFASDLNVAFGFEWRNEEFEITVGDAASYAIGPLADQGFSAASNGFPGFSPLAGGSWDRSNIAAYIDLEANITDAWLVGVALRGEDFDDFGTTTNGKISTNLELTSNVSLRGSYSTGDLVNNGTIPSTNPVAQLRGGEPLAPEESVNYTAGIIFQAGELSVTIDYFNIELTDRIAVSQDIDIVATWGTSLGDGDLDLSLAFNNTETTVDNFSPEIISDKRIRQLEEGLPQTRWNVTGIYSLGDFRITSRLSYFDEFYDSEDDQTYGDEILVDLEGSYTFGENYTLILGAQNLLDEYPDENPGAASGVGNLYSQFSPSGFGGGFYYIRMKYDY